MTPPPSAAVDVNAPLLHTTGLTRHFRLGGLLSRRMLHAVDDLDLTIREREIVALVAQGYKNKEMAEKMFISEQTVKNHLHNIFDKLGVSDRLELALYAIHHRLIDQA